MNTSDTGYSIDFSRRPRRVVKPDYREKLAQTPRAKAHQETPFVRALTVFTAEIEALGAHAATDTVAFQCVAVAALKTLDRVRGRELRAAEAAISLGQRQRLQRMIATAEAAAEALEGLLNERGRRMGHRAATAPEMPNETSWWFALCETIQVLEDAIAWIETVGAGQPHDGPVRALGRSVGSLLTRHYELLLAEAEHWFD